MAWNSVWPGWKTFQCAIFVLMQIKDDIDLQYRESRQQTRWNVENRQKEQERMPEQESYDIPCQTEVEIQKFLPHSQTVNRWDWSSETNRPPLKDFLFTSKDKSVLSHRHLCPIFLKRKEKKILSILHLVNCALRKIIPLDPWQWLAEALKHDVSAIITIMQTCKFMAGSGKCKSSCSQSFIQEGDELGKWRTN